MNDSIFIDLTYSELLESYTNDFRVAYGQKKYDKIYKKIQISKKVSDLIYVSEQKMVVPTEKDFLYCLNEIPYFIFSKADTLAMGGLLSLARWNSQCNKKYFIADENDLKDIAINIIRDCNKIKFKRN